MVLQIAVPSKKLEETCRRYDVQELAVFGSALRDDFRDDSDVDILVEFAPSAEIGLIEYAALQRELSETLGRKVDLVSKRGLKQFIRDEALESARVIYAA